jgi:hypothetical protein
MPPSIRIARHTRPEPTRTLECKFWDTGTRIEHALLAQHPLPLNEQCAITRQRIRARRADDKEDEVTDNSDGRTQSRDVRNAVGDNLVNDREQQRARR